jgi:hypothetical protein
VNAITIADDSNLVALIQTATRRLVFLAPAVSTPVAKALLTCLEHLGADAVTITLDVDAETYRLGYGDPAVLDVLYEATRRGGNPLRRQEGLRIGVVISDDLMIAFAPTPLLIEAGPQQAQRPNAIIVVGPPPISILRELGFGENGCKDQTIGLDLTTDGGIKAVQEDLRISPPQKFDLARTVRVLEATERLMKASFRVVDHADELSGERLEHDKKLIVRSFLKSLAGYGNAILRTHKEEFEKSVKKLREQVAVFRKQVVADLQKAMDKNRKSLRQALLPSLLKNPPKEWRNSDGSQPKDSILEQWLNDDLLRAFGTAEKLVGKMEVNVLYKAVTYESLQDQKFIEVAKKAFPSLENILDESIAVKGNSE